MFVMLYNHKGFGYINKLKTWTMAAVTKYGQQIQILGKATPDPLHKSRISIDLFKGKISICFPSLHRFILMGRGRGVGNPSIFKFKMDTHRSTPLNSQNLVNSDINVCMTNLLKRSFHN